MSDRNKSKFYVGLACAKTQKKIKLLKVRNNNNTELWKNKKTKNTTKQAFLWYYKAENIKIYFPLEILKQKRIKN